MPVKTGVGTPIYPTSSSTLLTTTILPVPYHAQQQTNWCWAACSEMTIEFLAVGPATQCDIATLEFGANCRAAPASSICNQPAWPNATFNRFGVHFLTSPGSVSQAGVQVEIGAGRPLHVYYAWRGGGAHLAVVRGFFSNGDLDVLDPWFGQGRRSYTNVLSAYGMGSWALTYTGIRK
jgi:hypothetical protein